MHTDWSGEASKLHAFIYKSPPYATMKPNTSNNIKSSRPLTVRGVGIHLKNAKNKSTKPLRPRLRGSKIQAARKNIGNRGAGQSSNTDNNSGISRNQSGLQTPASDIFSKLAKGMGVTPTPNSQVATIVLADGELKLPDVYHKQFYENALLGIGNLSFTYFGRSYMMGDIFGPYPKYHYDRSCNDGFAVYTKTGTNVLPFTKNGLSNRVLHQIVWNQLRVRNIGEVNRSVLYRCFNNVTLPQEWISLWLERDMNAIMQAVSRMFDSVPFGMLERHNQAAMNDTWYMWLKDRLFGLLRIPPIVAGLSAAGIVAWVLKKINSFIPITSTKSNFKICLLIACAVAYRFINVCRKIMDYRVVGWAENLGGDINSVIGKVKEGTKIITAKVLGQPPPRSLKQIIPQVVNTKLAFPLKNLGNLATSMIARQCKHTPFEIKAIRDFRVWTKREIMDKLNNKKPMMGYHEWLGSRSWSLNKASFYDALEKGTYNATPLRLCFVKGEICLADKSKPGRLVSASVPELQTKFGALTCTAMKGLKESAFITQNGVYPACGMSRIELGKVLQDCINSLGGHGDVAYISGDFSKFDASVNEHLMDIEIDSYEALVDNEQALIAEFGKRIKAPMVLAGFSKTSEVIVKTPACRASGDPDTTYGNTVINMAFFSYLRARAHLAINQMKALVCGDDVLIITRKENIPKLMDKIHCITELGVNLVLEDPVYDYYLANFLSGTFIEGLVDGVVQPVHIMMLGRSLSKTGITEKLWINKHQLAAYKMDKYCAWSDNCWYIPMLRNFAIAEINRLENEYAKYNKYRSKVPPNWKLIIGGHVDVTENTVDQFLDRYEITRDQYEDMEKQLQCGGPKDLILRGAYETVVQTDLGLDDNEWFETRAASYEDTVFTLRDYSDYIQQNIQQINAKIPKNKRKTAVKTKKKKLQKPVQKKKKKFARSGADSFASNVPVPAPAAVIKALGVQNVQKQRKRRSKTVANAKPRQLYQRKQKPAPTGPTMDGPAPVFRPKSSGKTGNTFTLHTDPVKFKSAGFVMKVGENCPNVDRDNRKRPVFTMPQKKALGTGFKTPSLKRSNKECLNRRQRRERDRQMEFLIAQQSAALNEHLSDDDVEMFDFNKPDDIVSSVPSEVYCPTSPINLNESGREDSIPWGPSMNSRSNYDFSNIPK